MAKPEGIAICKKSRRHMFEVEEAIGMKFYMLVNFSDGDLE